MSKRAEILFEARTPLGFTVRVMRDYWRIITTLKHPVMAGCEAQVQEVLETPEQIRRSESEHERVSFLPQPTQAPLGLRREQTGRPRGVSHHGVSN